MELTRMTSTMNVPIFFEPVEAEMSIFSAGGEGVRQITAEEGWELCVVGTDGEEEGGWVVVVDCEGEEGFSWDFGLEVSVVRYSTIFFQSIAIPTSFWVVEVFLYINVGVFGSSLQLGL